jgi:ornithine--oxo-acid transaminase
MSGLRRLRLTSWRLFNSSAATAAPSLLPALAAQPVLVRGRGARVWDTAGRAYLDFAALDLPLGHSHPALVSAVAAQAATLATSSSALASAAAGAPLDCNDPGAQAAAAVADAFSYPQAFLFNSARGASDAAHHIARHWHTGADGLTQGAGDDCINDSCGHSRTQQRGRKSVALHVSNPQLNSSSIPVTDLLSSIGFGGADAFGNASPASRDWLKYVRTGAAVTVPYGDTDALERTVDAFNSINCGAKRVSAVFIDPLQLDTGLNVLMASEGREKGRDYMDRLSALCASRDLLLVSDERRTAFGRAGHMRYGDVVGVDSNSPPAFRPHIVLLGPSLIGGLFPFSSMLVSEMVPSRLLPQTGWAGAARLTTSPLACAALRATLDTVSRDGLVPQASKLGNDFKQRLRKRVRSRANRVLSPMVRGKGLLNVLIVGEEDGATARDVVSTMAQSGVLTSCEQNVILLAPPLSITERELHVAITVICKAIGKVVRRRYGSPYPIGKVLSSSPTVVANEDVL